MENSGRLDAGCRIHAVDIGDPLVRGGHFAVRLRSTKAITPPANRDRREDLGLYSRRRGGRR